jgi:hypothetical protein
MAAVIAMRKLSSGGCVVGNIVVLAVEEWTEALAVLERVEMPYCFWIVLRWMRTKKDSSSAEF